MTLANRHFLLVLSAYAANELLSLAGFLQAGLGTAAAIGIAGLAFALAMARLRWAIYLVLAELFVGGKGYLFSLPLWPSGTLSIRMALFLIVVSVGISQTLFRLRSKKIPHRSKEVVWSSGFGAILAYGIAHGLAHHPFTQVFFDANGWLFILLLPVVTIALRDSTVPARLVQLLAGAVVVLGIKSAVLVYLFGHAPSDALLPVYQWIRHTGVGEITPVSGSLFRIFFQSHLYGMVGWLVLLTLIVHRAFQDWADLAVAGIALYLGSLSLLISQSRSLWIGAVAAAALLIGHAMWRRNLGIAPMVLAVGAMVAVLSSQLTVVNLIAGNAQGNVLVARFTDLGLEPAGSSRKHQLGPLISAIQKHPWLGSGFGQTVTYQSFDPRVMREHPGGWYTTVAFEWGYLDIALKLGLVGLTVYLIWVARLVWIGLARRVETPAAKFALAAVIGLVGIAVANIFSPYLNHPLGLGWVMVAVVSLNAVDGTATPVALRQTSSNRG